MAKKETPQTQVTGGNSNKGRRAIDWTKTPVAIFIGSSPTAVAAFINEDEAIKYLDSKLTLSQKEKAFVGRLAPIVVETTIKLKA